MEDQQHIMEMEYFDNEILGKNNLVLLEFFGTWCMPCKMESGILDKVEANFGDALKVIRLDLDANLELSKKYSVMTVPTMIVFKNGEEAEKMVGFRQINQITEIINKYKDE